MRWQRPARKRAIFFCAVALVFLLSGMLVTASCSHTSAQRGDEVTPMPEETVDSIPGELMEEPEGALPARKKLGRLRIEEVTVELEKAQAENTSLREENDWLRSEIARLEGALVDANQTIYLLERKLDAIFKPNNVVEVIE